MPDHTDLYKKMRREVREALWQWLVDHSSVMPTGRLRIVAELKNEDDLWRRVYFRYTGQFERYNKEERAQKGEWAAFKRMQHDSKKMHDTAQAIDKNKNYYWKLILWLYRKTRDKLKKYNN